MRIEEFLLRSNDNKRATEALFTGILAHDPTDLFLLGDVVNLGYKNSRWAFIDTALVLARQRGFNVHAILGNHELMGRSGAGERVPNAKRLDVNRPTGVKLSCGLGQVELQFRLGYGLAPFL